MPRGDWFYFYRLCRVFDLSISPSKQDEASMLLKIKKAIAQKAVFSSSEIEEFFPSEYSSKINPLAGIVFDVHSGVGQNDSNATGVKINYRLRFTYKPRNSGEKNSLRKQDKDWKTRFAYPIFQFLGPREDRKPKGGDPGYYREGFLYAQNGLNKGIGDFLMDRFPSSFSSSSSSSSSNSSSSSPLAEAKIQLKRFPYPPYTNDLFVNAIQINFPFIFVLSFVVTVLDIVKNVTVEKEKKLKESMKIMVCQWYGD